MATCTNCGDAAESLYHLVLATDDVMEMYLCGSCRDRFERVEWVELISE